MSVVVRGAVVGLLAWCLFVSSGHAQRGGRGGFRIDPILVDPVVRDGPPTQERLGRLVALSEVERESYDVERAAMLKETRIVRDSARQSEPLAALAFGGNPRTGLGLDRETQLQFEAWRHQRKELADAQERLDDWLRKEFGKDRVKPYEAWRLEQQQAAMAGFRQELLRRLREEGGAFGP